VAILDADKEGYLRSTTSLIQTAGRAARHLTAKSFCMRGCDDPEHPKFWPPASIGAKNSLLTIANTISPRGV
jgi:hypothetical protein